MSDPGRGGPPANAPPQLPESLIGVIMPEGLSLAILVVAVFFSVAALLVVALRICVRAKAGILGLDDWLMATGLMLYLASTGIVAYATFKGLGTSSAEVDGSMRTVGIKYITIWQLFYIPSLVFIKVSICITVLRIAIRKHHKWVLYATLALSITMGLAGFIGVLAVCQPFYATWSLVPGACADKSVTIDLNFMMSAAAVVTDGACAIVPAFILWEAQLEKKVKLSVGIVLGLGSLASISTFVKFPYIQYFGNFDRFLNKMGYIALCSVFEGGIGLVAGSLPMLRMFFRRWIGSAMRATTHEQQSNLTRMRGGKKSSTALSTLQRPCYSLRGGIPKEEGAQAGILEDTGISEPQIHGGRGHLDVDLESSEVHTMRDIRVTRTLLMEG